jgi:biopolymer transport protein ExbD
MSDELRIPGRKKHARKPEPETDPEFQIAPMIDILLVLLVFFMSITSTEVLQSNDAVDLPVAKEAKEPKKGANAGQMIINVLHNPISNASVIEVDERNPTPNELINTLQAKVASNPQYRVLIRADKNVRYEFMRSLLENIGKSGVGNVTFSVVDKEDTSKKSS